MVAFATAKISDNCFEWKKMLVCLVESLLHAFTLYVCLENQNLLEKLILTNSIKICALKRVWASRKQGETCGNFRKKIFNFNFFCGLKW